jgi:hypothetical protein
VSLIIIGSKGLKGVVILISQNQVLRGFFDQLRKKCLHGTSSVILRDSCGRLVPGTTSRSKEVVEKERCFECFVLK